MTNDPDSHEGTSAIDLSQHVFMPFIEINFQTSEKEVAHLDVFEENSTDVIAFEKLKTFLDFFAIQKTNKFGKETGELQDLRLCTE